MTDHNNPQIFVLDDDPSIKLLLENITGFSAIHFVSSIDAQSALKNYSPIACFVDIHLDEDDNGLDIIPELRREYHSVPIIVTSGTQDKNAIGEALASGADDYIQKPLIKEEVNARLQIRLHEHSRRKNQTEIRFGDLCLDTQQRSLTSTVDTHRRYLSPTEMNLLLCLVEAQGGVVKRETVKQRCWGRVYVSDNALNRKIHETRKVITDVSKILSIRTIYGSGFSIDGLGKQVPMKDHSSVPTNLNA